MGIEIERKFLVRNESWRDAATDPTEYRQGYLSNSERGSVRVRASVSGAKLNIKSAELGARRLEYEYEIPAEDAAELLSGLCVGPLVEKTRYRVHYQGHEWEVDVFSGDNAGLVVAEIELQDEHEAFERPDWVGEEVTDESRYYNVCLSSHPFKDW